MWLGLQTVSSLERCPLFRVSFIERFHCTHCNYCNMVHRAKWRPSTRHLNCYHMYVDKNMLSATFMLRCLLHWWPWLPALVPMTASIGAHDCQHWWPWLPACLMPQNAVMVLPWLPAYLICKVLIGGKMELEDEVKPLLIWVHYSDVS